jgi:diguanylate cyclase (GGDEF)-like protein
VQGHAGLVELLEPHTESGLLLVPRHTRSPELAALLAAGRVRDCLLVPMRSEGEVVGTLAVADKLGDVATFTPADLRQLQALANHAAVAIDNAVRAHLIIRQAEEREHQAMHDDITGLPNRRLLGRRLDETLRRGRASVLLLDLDRFREVNDTLGHEIGDRLLGLVAERLREAAPTDALVARFGGDEFAVLLPGAWDLDARACVSVVQAALSRPFVLDGMAVAVDASVGVAVGEPGTDGVSVVRWADLALYAAKETRAGFEVYRPELDLRDASRIGLLADLRIAVASNTLAVHYQPKVDVRTGAVTGVEALARWQHPEHGAIGPDEFIPLAEHSSLITPLTMLVLRTALTDCETWQAVGGGFTVAVNISPRSLLDPGFVDEVARALAVVSVPASSLTLEITETSLMTNPEGAIAALGRLRGIGVRLSVDDLGTGYSSLAYLQRLPVNEIKIDRSFLAGMGDPSTRAVVGAIIDLGHRLDRHVVAEGIEDAESFEMLRVLGCDSAQGFWLGRPMPAPQLTSFLVEHAHRREGGLRRVR